MLQAVLDDWDMAVNQTNKVPALIQLVFFRAWDEERMKLVERKRQPDKKQMMVGVIQIIYGVLEEGRGRHRAGYLGWVEGKAFH